MSETAWMIVVALLCVLFGYLEFTNEELRGIQSAFRYRFCAWVMDCFAILTVAVDVLHLWER